MDTLQNKPVPPTIDPEDPNVKVIATALDDFYTNKLHFLQVRMELRDIDKKFDEDLQEFSPDKEKPLTLNKYPVDDILDHCCPPEFERPKEIDSNPLYWHCLAKKWETECRHFVYYYFQLIRECLKHKNIAKESQHGAFFEEIIEKQIESIKKIHDCRRKTAKTRRASEENIKKEIRNSIRHEYDELCKKRKSNDTKKRAVNNYFKKEPKYLEETKARNPQKKDETSDAYNLRIERLARNGLLKRVGGWKAILASGKTEQK